MVMRKKTSASSLLASKAATPRDFGTAMVLWSLLGWGWEDTVIKVYLLFIISLLQDICICANYVQISHMTTMMISAL